MRHAQTLDVERLERALHSAIQDDDVSAVREAVHAAVQRHADATGGLIERVLMPAISFLIARQNPSWIEALWLQPSGSTLFEDLSERHAQIILEGMVQREEIDFSEQAVLARLARRWPHEVLVFFGKRLELEKTQAPEHYRAMPSTLTKLSDVWLSRIASGLYLDLAVGFRLVSRPLVLTDGTVVAVAAAPASIAAPPALPPLNLVLAPVFSAGLAFDFSVLGDAAASVFNIKPQAAAAPKGSAP